MSDPREPVHVPCYHVLTMAPQSFRVLALGLQTAVVLPRSLRIDRGDQLVVRERAEGDECTPAWLCRKVTHIETGMDDPGADLFWSAGVDDRFAVYSLNSAAENGWTKDALVGRLAKAGKEGKTPDEFWAGLAMRESARRGILRPRELLIAGLRAT